MGAGLFFRSGADAEPCGVHFREKFFGDGIAGTFAENSVHSAVGAKSGSCFVADPFCDFYGGVDVQTIKTAADFVMRESFSMIGTESVSVF